MESLKRAGFLLLAFTLSACGLATKTENFSNGGAESAVSTGHLQGSLSDLEGHPIDLADDHAKAQVLMFVSETCSVCRAETKALVEDHRLRGTPTNVDFLSVVVGSVLEDATDWRDGLGVSWSVAVDPGDSLFRSYCPSLQTPCVVLRNPFLNQYKTLIGEHSLSDWETFTGTWSY